MPYLDEYRLALGTVSSSTLDSSDTYKWVAFPAQTDQSDGREWYPPDSASETVEQGMVLDEALDARLYAYGSVNFDWITRALTPLMVKYILDTYFANGAFTAACTVKTWARDGGGWRYYQGLVRRRFYRDGAEMALGGYDKLRLEFRELTEIDAPS